MMDKCRSLGLIWLRFKDHYAMFSYIVGWKIIICGFVGVNGGCLHSLGSTPYAVDIVKDVQCSQIWLDGKITVAWLQNSISLQASTIL